MNSIKNHYNLEKIFTEDDRDLNSLYSILKLNGNCCLSTHIDSPKSSISKFLRYTRCM